ncbi:MAG: class I SAM-dependent methyltransferase [Planctomycetia bacterium]|nr:class I SAM-dependent methyltransferase [Planctomycetia bacterium]
MTGDRSTSDSILAVADRFDLETLAWALDRDIEPDCHFYEAILQRNAGLALEAGCGTGRLLVALLRADFQIEGCDISSDMLSFCQFHAEVTGFKPTLHLCAIENLPFVNRYSVILIACGTFMCITESDQVDRCLATLHANLVPGGQLVISLIPATYLHLVVGPFPTPWEPYYQMTLPKDSGTLIVDWRATDICSTQQIVSEECRYRWVAGESIIREEISAGQHRWYHRDQFLARLRRAGFCDIEVYSDYSDKPSDGFDAVLSFVATRTPEKV